MTSQHFEAPCCVFEPWLLTALGFFLHFFSLSLKQMMASGLSKHHLFNNSTYDMGNEIPNLFLDLFFQLLEIGGGV